MSSSDDQKPSGWAERFGVSGCALWPRQRHVAVRPFSGREILGPLIIRERASARRGALRRTPKFQDLHAALDALDSLAMKYDGLCVCRPS